MLKYAKEIAMYVGCPPSDAEPWEGQAYRFVYETIEHEKNFLPVAKLSPRRELSDDHACCIAHALSMFATKRGAVSRYKEIQKTHKRIHKTIGTHLAEGTLKPNDGIATPADGRQHFSFFEEAGRNLAESFRIVEVLHDDKN